MITLVLLLGCFGNLVAQEDTYVVQKGDNLWNLAGAHLDDAKLWEQIYKDNPFLQEPGRRFQKEGIVYVMVRPGEKLYGLEKIGITATMTPIEQLRLPQPEAKIYHVATTPAWVWWPLALAIALIIAAWLIYRMLTRDPVNSRPAMVPGGVTEATATTAIQRVAARTAGYTQEQSLGQNVYQQFTIIRRTAGRIWGNMTVRYADGRSVPRRLNSDRAYQAEVRFSDGHTETLYMLQGCGNDLRYGGISRYLPGPEFRFEADPAPVAVPAQPVPEPAPAPVAPVPAPVAEAPAPVSGEFVRTKDTPTTLQPDGVITFEFKRSNNGQPNMVRLQGIEAEEFTFSVGPDGTTLRYREVEEEQSVGASK
ncbi:MAG: hypothetical protein A3A96_00420 [Candidatus Zambryskibacteria bacterium RIFCSPLOWO2_01_FULL_39_39]|uniref:LysM domain-containing protein n=1 Tax=Candidatus Zambryskibacteria bacterium RIFCSPLOWO2_01_FULL_39_39 TaxID=1802758 RepID=A0A1G2TZ37_9BACT|nr:MAG: 5'-nucleotidase [Parcubacteria group bacterium GW2011_GWA1_38_7]OHB01890.1 MAG: hypothetical protein A3A96_00420 [Candidatus Zambryskibacteria bacterium RIFCSPLOWO2_01_FULL_39_39]